MTVRVLVFGHYRDGLPEPARASGLAMDLPTGASVADVAVRLSGENPLFADLLMRTRVAVRAEFASPDTLLEDGDEVAFLPPMSGG